MEHIADVDPALEDDRIVWNVRPDSTLVASLEVSRMLVASNGDVPKKTMLGNSKIGQAKPVFSC